MAGKKSARRAGEAVRDRAEDFAKAFYGLKMVFAKYEKYLHVNADTREKYYLETRSPSYNGRPLFFWGGDARTSVRQLSFDAALLGAFAGKRDFRKPEGAHAGEELL